MISTDPIFNEIYIVINYGQYKFETGVPNHSLPELERLKSNLHYMGTSKNQFETRGEGQYK